MHEQGSSSIEALACSAKLFSRRRRRACTNRLPFPRLRRSNSVRIGFNETLSWFFQWLFARVRWKLQSVDVLLLEEEQRRKKMVEGKGARETREEKKGRRILEKFELPGNRATFARIPRLFGDSCANLFRARNPICLRLIVLPASPRDPPAFFAEYCPKGIVAWIIMALRWSSVIIPRVFTCQYRRIRIVRISWLQWNRIIQFFE